MQEKLKAALYLGLGFIAAVTLCWLIYAPGLHGGFLFDDFANLDALGSGGPIHDWPSFLRYITSGSADPIGRPLTLLSFLIDAQNWPADPYPFKRTSLLLHILNGALLFRACLTLLDQSSVTRRFDIRIAAGMSSVFWLVHPLFVSTVLYVVQREAVLATTFTLCGLLAWCHGRALFQSGAATRGIVWLVIGAWGCTLLAALCKANGLVLPLLIGVAECTLLKKSELNTRFGSWRRILLGIPIFLLLAYLLLSIPTFERSAAENRPWTLMQRLMSEPRFLLDYLRLLWLPRATSFGIFNDQAIASSTIADPWTTLPSLMFIVGVCTWGWWARTRFPIMSFAILFFFSGHLMESTVLPLELVFEHRNYLPALFIFLPLACELARFSRPALRRTAAVIIAVLLSALTAERSQVWGDRYEQALIWGKINPDSARAQALAASVELERGEGSTAVARLRGAIEKSPANVQLTLNLAQTQCQLGAVPDETWTSIFHSLTETSNNARTTVDWFVAAIGDAQSKRCAGLTFAQLDRALEAARSNPKFGHQRGRQQDYFHIEGRLALAEHDGAHALDAFDQAILQSPDRGIGLLQVGLLATAGFKTLALRHLEFVELQPVAADAPAGMPRIHAWVLERQHFWENETNALRTTLQRELEDQDDNA